jgi:hypothetical protein
MSIENPPQELTADEVRAELNRILASAEFTASRHTD